jgi:RES domain-containing protein
MKDCTLDGPGVTAFRLTDKYFPKCDGEGARLYGGRWNEKGTRVVYFSDSESLCILELLANKSVIVPDGFVLITPTIPDDIRIERVSPDALSGDTWKSPIPANQAITWQIGTAWARAGTSAILIVPSAVIGSGRNLLVNPEHPDFARIELSPPAPFTWDDRLLRGCRRG